MASYILVGSASIVQVLSPKVSEEVVVCTVQTKPSGVIAAMPVAQELFDAGQAAPMLATFADNIELILSQGRAIGASGTSSLDASGLQAFFVTFEVGYNPPGAPTGTVTVDVDVPAPLLYEGVSPEAYGAVVEAEAIVDKAYANLVSLSGNTSTSGTAAAAPATAAASSDTTG